MEMPDLTQLLTEEVLATFNASPERREKVKQWLNGLESVEFVEAITVKQRPWLLNSAGVLGIMRFCADKELRAKEIAGRVYSVWRGSLHLDDTYRTLNKVGVDTCKLNKCGLGMEYHCLEVIVLIDNSANRGYVHIVDVSTGSIY